ncbi:MAG TPA: ATP-binding protein [Roseiflexaceae bacterium]|nr:ATP-binding protein [Roseiflexaceae bacterium]
MELALALLTLALLTSLGVNVWLAHRARTPPATLAPTPQEQLPPLFHAVAAALDAGLILVDAERRARYLSPQAAELLGGQEDAAGGRALIALLRDYRADALVGEVLQDGEARELLLQPAPGGRTLRLRATALAHGVAPEALILLRDVTQLSVLERARRDMVANVSHELRTPLASVKLLVETLQSGPPPPVAARMLGQMAQEVDALTQLVDELHELSQIESGRLALQLAPAELAPVVARAIERIRPQAGRKGLHIAASLPTDLPLALLDSERVGRVLLNLLHNAVKFTPEGGEIRVAASPLAVPPLGHPPGAWLLVQVADSGTGIPVEDLPRIFERFYKVDRARTREAGGTGLGLAIARHLVEGHGGRIWAESAEGRGSSFFFTLPTAVDRIED